MEIQHKVYTVSLKFIVLYNIPRPKQCTKYCLSMGHCSVWDLGPSNVTDLENF